MSIDERIAAELRRHAPQVDEHMAWDRIRSAAPVRRHSRARRLATTWAAAVGFLVVGSILVPTFSSGPGAEHPGPEQAALWPQSSLEEVQEAQRLADAGDADFTWQLEPALEDNLSKGHYQGDPEIFARFLREELGWEEFYRVPGPGTGFGEFGFTTFLTYVRCAPGQSNAAYPDDPRPGGCAPTIDENRFERVEITAAQPVRQDPSGVWVVTQWENLEPIEQVIPLTVSEATAIVEAFLQARIDGAGAEQYFAGGDGTAPLLYATSTGVAYDRYEFELVSGPEWPNGGMGFEVRLFAEQGQTVVGQSFSLERDRPGRWGLHAGPETFENGQELPTFHEFLDGEVTFEAAPPWDYSFAGWEFSPTMTTLHLGGLPEVRFVVLADPQPVETGCSKAQAPAGAEELASSLRSDPDLETTEAIQVHIADIEALQMDVVGATSGNLCAEVGVPEVVAGGTATGLEPGQRMRLYLVDLSGGSARILSIAIVAPEARFESVMQQAAPILDSFEFHTR